MTDSHPAELGVTNPSTAAPAPTTGTHTTAARRLALALAALTIAVSAGFVGYAIRGDTTTGTGPGTGQFPGAPGAGQQFPNNGQFPSAGQFPGGPGAGGATATQRSTGTGGSTTG